MRKEENNISIEMWIEHGCNHVRVHDYNNGRLLWDAFDTYSQAERAYNRCVNFFHEKTARKPMNLVRNRDGSAMAGTVSCKHFNSDRFTLIESTRLTTK